MSLDINIRRQNHEDVSMAPGGREQVSDISVTETITETEIIDPALTETETETMLIY